jgi:hypothetical protein
MSFRAYERVKDYLTKMKETPIAYLYNISCLLYYICDIEENLPQSLLQMNIVISSYLRDLSSVIEAF